MALSLKEQKMGLACDFEGSRESPLLEESIAAAFAERTLVPQAQQVQVFCFLCEPKTPRPQEVGGFRDGEWDFFDQLVNLTNRAKFKRLARRWSEETAGMSILQQAVRHPDFQGMVEMGSVAIPWLLEELQHHPDHWNLALAQIAGEDPSVDARNFQEARAAWLRWGREKGYLGGG